MICVLICKYTGREDYDNNERNKRIMTIILKMRETTRQEYANK